MDFLPENIAKELASLWDSSPNPPDVFAFLTQNGCVRPETLVPVLAVDQKYRWKTDTPLKVEDYLARLPHLVDDPAFKLQLAVNEFIARRVAETHVDIAEYTSRFSDISDELRSALAEVDSNAVREKIRSLTTTATLLVDPSLGVGRLGRYRLLRILGEGAFGRVYLAYDEELERQVAIKVPTPQRFQKPEDALQYLAEARTVANLDHPNIVPVYDMGRTEEGSVYVVSKYVEGCTLENQIKRDRPDHETTSKWLSTIALALHHAHSRRLIHRDVKPGNILLEGDDPVPYLADFGLAIREEEFLREGTIAGTPAYMSPEQARGEGHRLDGRSDIFSLGVILYEMLTGHRPFRGSSSLELMVQVTTAEPRPLRAYDPAISPELERICMKALAKRASDRYETAVELADDLLHWNQTPVQEKREMTIVPKGLRSFDAEDADFFLDLLPGPRTRSGLPENLQFWKTRIEEPDPEKTFSVGLIYGPSGCGKSSLMKAGLLPRLSRGVVSVYLEATPDETEIRILRGLRKALLDLPPELGLVESFIWLRQREKSASKVVVILDQFEQWLHAHGAEKETDLVKALRHCDGKYLQAIVMVRDDFAMAASRLMRELDSRMIEGVNFMTIDKFDVDHAEKVLFKFGQAFGKLPQDHEKMTEGETTFVQRVASGLGVEGKVVSVQIALFAEMVKGKPWTLQSLEDVGGTEGVGVNFLEETFSSREANPEHRLHQQAARQILAALLPEVGTEIKGHMQSHAALLDAAGYADRPTEFTDLLRILDGELRLITPMDPEGDSLNDSARSSSLATRYYQLTHDFLVPSLREWLTRKQRETKRGRAELKLAERAAAWKNLEENKQLPTFLEWLQIRRWTEASKWRSHETRVMQRADRYHTVRAGMIASTLLLLTAVGWGVKRSNDRQRLESYAENLVVTLQKADYTKVADELSKLAAIRSIIDPKLKNAVAASTADSDEHLKLSLALLPTDPSQLDTLVPRLQSADTTYVRLLIDQLRPNRETIVEPLWTMIEESSGNATCLPVASALADYAPEDPRWAGIAARVTDQLVRENALRVSTWIDLLRPVAKHLNPELQSVYAASLGDRTQTQIDLATEILEIYAASDFSTLHELVLTGQPTQFSRLFDEYATFKKEAIAELRLEVARSFESDPKASDEENEAAQIALTERQANAAVALMRLEDPRPVYEFLTVDRDPEGLSQFIHRIRGREVSPSLLVRGFDELRALPTPADPLLRRQHEFRIYGMLLGLGWFAVDELPTAERDRLVEDLGGMYASHPSRAVHSALGWLLRQWGEEEAVRKVDETPVDYDPSGEREWYVVKVRPPEVEVQTSETDETDQTSLRSPDSPPPIFFTMVVFPGGAYSMGERGDQQMVEVAGPIAVSDREVTWRQFSPIDGDSHRQSWEQQFQREPHGRRLLDDEPAFGVSWFDAVNYCRWLTSAYLPGEEFQCYSQKEFTADQVPEPGWINLSASEEWPMDASRPGFRLMTEAEWEYVARAGMETEYSFGTSEGLLDDYGWYDENSEGWSHRTGVKRPSMSGLFDIHGNLLEWTNDLERSYRVDRGGCWIFTASDCRSANRSWDDPSNRLSSLGFRLLLSSVGQVQPAEPEQAE